MDGVIIDSNSEIERFWIEWLEKEGIQYTKQDIHQYIHGCKTASTIDHLFKKSTDQTKTEILNAAISFDMEMKPILIPGVITLLKNLQLITNNIALVTSAAKQRAQKMIALHNLNNHFSVLVTGDMIQYGKPHPEPYLKAAYLLNMLPEDCLVFEDSDNGIRSAIDAGMQVIAVRNQALQHKSIMNRINDFDDLFTGSNQITYPAV